MTPRNNGKQTGKIAPFDKWEDPRLLFILNIDASNVGLGAILSQEGEKGERVIAYFSQAFNRAECNYCITRCELFSCGEGSRPFQASPLWSSFCNQNGSRITALAVILQGRNRMARPRKCRWRHAMRPVNLNVMAFQRRNPLGQLYHGSCGRFFPLEKISLWLSPWTIL